MKKQQHSGIWCVEFVLPQGKVSTKHVNIFDRRRDAESFMNDIEEAGMYHGLIVIEVSMWEM